MVAAACLLAVGALVWHLGILPAIGHGYSMFGNGVDAKVYRGGGFAVLHGLPVYDGPVYKIWQFTYPPFAAIGAAPLGLVGVGNAVLAVNLTNVVCLFAVVALSLRALGYVRDRRFWLAAVALSVGATLLQPIQTTIWNGQVNLLIAVLIIGGLTLLNGPWRGLGVGLAAGIKLTPIFFVAYLAVTRQFKAAVVAVAAFAVTVLLGFVVLREQASRFWLSALDDTSRIGPINAIANQSVNGFVHRLGDLGFGSAPSWTWIVVGAVFAAAGLYTAWQAHRAGALLLAITVTGMTMCAVSPFSWGHHWVWVLPLLVITLVTASESVQRSRPVTWLWWLAPVGVVAATFVWPARYVTPSGSEGFGFGIYRLGWTTTGQGLERFGALVASGTYLWVFLITLAVTLWWCRQRDPIRLPESQPSRPPEAAR